MDPRILLRAEGGAAFAAATAGYVVVGGPWWLYVALVLVPDLSMAGYLSGPTVGAFVYNLGHLYLWPLLLGAVGLWQGVDYAILVALVWAAHVGADRALGFGLKQPTGFRHTHLDAR